MKIKNIVWGVDSSSDDRNLQNQCLKAISRLAPEANVQPACVVTPAALLENRAGFSDLLQGIENVVLGDLTKWMASLDHANLAQPEVVLEERFSVNQSVERLIEYAQNKGADLIVVSTHARKGLRRVLMGSFAETLLCRSNIPVMVVNPDAKLDEKIERILIPTDFTNASETVYSQTLELASALGSKIRLFHQIEYVNDFSAPSFSASSVYAQYLKDDVEARKKQGLLWVDKAKAAGVDLEFVINDKAGYAIDGILANAKDCQLTIMASQTGQISSALLGSVTRQVARELEEPLLVVHF